MYFGRSRVSRKAGLVASGAAVAAIVCAAFAAPAGASLTVPQPQGITTPHAAAPSPSPAQSPAPAPSAPQEQSSGQSDGSDSSSQSAGSVPSSDSSTPYQSSFPGPGVPSSPSDPPFPDGQPSPFSGNCVDACRQQWLDWVTARQQDVWIEALATGDDDLLQNSAALGSMANRISKIIESSGVIPADGLDIPDQKMPSALRPEETPMDALSNIGDMIGNALAGSDGSGPGNIVNDLVAKGFELLNGSTTTICSKIAPEGKPGICPK